MVLALTSFLFATGFLDGWEYNLQSIPEPTGEYEIYSNGIVAVRREGIELYLKPANDIWLKNTTTLLGLLPLETVKPDDPYHFTDWSYYQEALEQKRRPQFFVVDVMFIASEAGLAFDPYDNGVILGGQHARLVKYAVVDTSQRSIVRLSHSRPWKKRTEGLLFDDKEREQALQMASSEQKFIPLPQTIGFILFFDCPPPVPGKDTFTLQLHGLRAHGVPVHQYDLRFTQTQQNQVYRH